MARPAARAGEGGLIARLDLIVSDPDLTNRADNRLADASTTGIMPVAV
jgi:hypothetical protein